MIVSLCDCHVTNIVIRINRIKNLRKRGFLSSFSAGNRQLNPLEVCFYGEFDGKSDGKRIGSLRCTLPFPSCSHRGINMKGGARGHRHAGLFGAAAPASPLHNTPKRRLPAETIRRRHGTTLCSGPAYLPNPKPTSTNQKPRRFRTGAPVNRSSFQIKGSDNPVIRSHAARAGAQHSCSG